MITPFGREWGGDPPPIASNIHAHTSNSYSATNFCLYVKIYLILNLFSIDSSTDKKVMT